MPAQTAHQTAQRQTPSRTAQPSQTVDDMALLERAYTALGRAMVNLSASRAGAYPGLPDRTSYFALMLLDERGPMRVSELATAVGLDVSTVSRMACQLGEAGYVEKDRDTSDGRAHLIALSTKGRGALAQACAMKRELLAEATAGWSHRDRSALARSMLRLAESLRDVR